jgi:hypothetical protein
MSLSWSMAKTVTKDADDFRQLVHPAADRDNDHRGCQASPSSGTQEEDPHWQIAQNDAYDYAVTERGMDGDDDEDDVDSLNEKRGRPSRVVNSCRKNKTYPLRNAAVIVLELAHLPPADWI